MPVANGGVVYSDSDMTFMTVAQHFCDNGFTLSGSVQRICQLDGIWSGIPASCEGMSSEPYDR